MGYLVATVFGRFEGVGEVGAKAGWCSGGEGFVGGVGVVSIGVEGKSRSDLFRFRGAGCFLSGDFFVVVGGVRVEAVW